MVCRYIMFCANTRPVPVDTTDLGEISELEMTLRSLRRSLSEGLPVQAAAAWALEVGEGLGDADEPDEVEEPEEPEPDADEEPPAEAWSLPPRVTANTTPAMTATSTRTASSATSRRRRYLRARYCLVLR